jgi:urease accessory protein
VRRDPPEARPQLDLAFARRLDRTFIQRRLFRWPFAVTRTFALDRAPPHMLTVIAQTSSGALHGEDDVRARLHVGANAAVHFTTQGATTVQFAAPGAVSREHFALRVEAGGCLEYLPEPRILFPDAALEQTLEIDCSADGFALVGDAFTWHDPRARGRGFRAFVSTTILRRGGEEPALIDRFDIASPGRGRTAQFKAFASLTLIAPRGFLELAPLADALTARLGSIPDLYAAASPLPDAAHGIGARLAGRDLRAVRAGLALVWTAARLRFHGAAPPSRRKGEEVGEPV